MQLKINIGTKMSKIFTCFEHKKILTGFGNEIKTESNTFQVMSVKQCKKTMRTRM